MNPYTQNIDYVDLGEVNVGVFWEFKESQFNRFLDPSYVGKQLVEFSRSFSSSRRFSVAQVFVDISENYCAGDLSSLGFEVISVEKNNERTLSSFFISSILMWLWDFERNNQLSGIPVVIIVPSTTEILPTLQHLKSRNVQVVVAIDFLTNDRKVWEICAHHVIDVGELASGFDENVNDFVQEKNFRSKPYILDHDFKCLMTSDAVIPTQNKIGSFGLDSTQMQNSNSFFENQTLFDFENFTSFPAPQAFMSKNHVIKCDDKKANEHILLQENLANAFRMKNVGEAVSTLRKIYTKQNQTFRIQMILNRLLENQSITIQQGIDGINPLLSDICFLLECIQWCFGAQKGDNIDCFTYKMNKNIAKWLLKEVQKKELNPQFQQKIYRVTVSVSKNILRQVPEFELALDLLSLAPVPEPIHILLPFISSWRRSSNPVVVRRVYNFAHEMGISLDGSHTDFSRPQLSHGLTRPGTHTTGSYPKESNRTLNEPFHFGSSSLQQPSTNGMADRDLVNLRLLSILKKSPKGILGGRIPDVYAAAFKEPLQLYNRRLKDVLLGLDCVEMIGTDGPGDKLFYYAGSI